MNIVAPSARWLTLVVGLVLFCGPVAITGDGGPLSPPSAEGAPPATKNKSKSSKKKTASSASHHGHIKAAIAKLHSAKKDLAAAPVKHGGHREKAQHHIDQALHQLHELEKQMHKK